MNVLVCVFILGMMSVFAVCGVLERFRALVVV